MGERPLGGDPGQINQEREQEQAERAPGQGAGMTPPLCWGREGRKKLGQGMWPPGKHGGGSRELALSCCAPGSIS